MRDKDREVLDKLEVKSDEGPERFAVKRVDYRPVAPAPVSPVNAGKAPRGDRWQETLARDPWVQEALSLVLDMGASKRPAPGASNMPPAAKKAP
jgi:hypothetical protein